MDELSKHEVTVIPERALEFQRTKPGKVVEVAVSAFGETDQVRAFIANPGLGALAIGPCLEFCAEEITQENGHLIWMTGVVFSPDGHAAADVGVRYPSTFSTFMARVMRRGVPKTELSMTAYTKTRLQ